MLGSDEIAQNDIRIVFGKLIVVGDFFDHMNVVFFVIFTEFGLQYNEKVISLLPLKGNRLSIRRHFSILNVDLTFNVSSAVIE